MTTRSSHRDTQASSGQIAQKKIRSRRRRIRNSLTFALSLFLIAIYSIDLGFNRRSENFARTQTALREQKDLLRAAEDIQVVFYDEQGQKSLTMNAKNAEFGAPHAMNTPSLLQESISKDPLDDDFLSHDEEPVSGMNHLLMNPVQLQSFKEQQLTATMRADFAFMDALENELHLAGSVQAQNRVQGSTLNTDSLSMNTESRQVFGNQPVELTFKNAKTNATGVQGSQLDGRWQLLSKVKTTLEIE